MKQLITIAIVIIAAVGVAVGALTPMTVRGDGSALSWEELNAELAAVESHITESRVGGYPTYTLHDMQARAGGISDETLRIAKEAVAFNNALTADALRAGTSNITHLDVDLTGYPKLKAYLDMEAAQNASQGGVSGRNDDSGNNPPPGSHPCGTEQYPVPNFNPARLPYTVSNGAEAYLLGAGYHRTVFYARRIDHDYTLGTDYESDYGYCPSPAFRFHAVIYDTNPNKYWLQRNEPNPEVHTYSSPYGFILRVKWIRYVHWWHEGGGPGT